MENIFGFVEDIFKWELVMYIDCCGLQLDSKHEAASAYVDAANCYKKSNPTGEFSTLSSLDDILGFDFL
jgi:hypothetical protein